PLLVPIQPRGQRRPLFCIHPIEGTVFGYAPLVRLLGADRPVWGVRAAGLEANETPCDGIKAMAEAYLEATRAIQPHGPYHLCGWSMGGLIAHEMARRLREDGEEIALLAVLDQGPQPSVAGIEPYRNRFGESAQRWYEMLNSASENELLQLCR